MKISRLVKLAGECGGYRFARFLTARNPRILMYHRFSKEPKPGYVDAKAFEWQVRHIAQHYNAITVSGLAEEIFSRGVASKNSIAITVDDGYRDFYNVAYSDYNNYSTSYTYDMHDKHSFQYATMNAMKAKQTLFVANQK